MLQDLDATHKIHIMNENTNTIQSNNPIQAQPPSNKLEILKNKKVLIGAGGGVLLIVAILLPFMINTHKTTKSDETNKATKEAQLTTVPQYTEAPQPTASVELQKAIDRQAKADEEYRNAQSAITDKYPWFREFPMYATTYYIYFDIPKNKFDGFLYPTSSDNVDQIKAHVMDKLKSKGVQTEKYQYEWTISPQ